MPAVKLRETALEFCCGTDFVNRTVFFETEHRTFVTVKADPQAPDFGHNSYCFLPKEECTNYFSYQN